MRVGGLYGGHYAAQAALRYELHWLPLLACKAPVKATRRVLVPPLDVAVAWLHHRLRPAVYERDCRDQVGEVSRVSVGGTAGGVLGVLAGGPGAGPGPGDDGVGEGR